MSDGKDAVEPGDEASMAYVTTDSPASTEMHVDEPVQELSMDEVSIFTPFSI